MTSAATANYISISPLEIDGRTIIPAFGLSADISNWGIRPVGLNGEQNYKSFPTLAQLRHAFETNEQIKANIRSQKYRGEHTATFLRDGKEAVEMPERVYFDKGRKLWVAEGSKVAKVELPPEGWTTEYDKPTGFPSRTSKRKEDAVRTFGDDASYFWKATNGLYAVRRDFLWHGEDGPFDVDARWQPDGGHGGFGSRPVQGSSVLTEPNLTEYERVREDVLREMRADFGKLTPEAFQEKYKLK